MRVGIDMSQTVYGTGVGNLLSDLVARLTRDNKENSYVLLFSSLRRKPTKEFLARFKNENISFKFLKFPPIILDLMWNRLHIFPIENFLGPLDIFISSDWTEPPTKKAKKVTILYDLVVYKVAKETDKRIVNVQKRKLSWVKKEESKIICISESTKKDAMELLGIEESRLKVIYPGVTV